jgi:hypothetical protein
MEPSVFVALVQSVVVATRQRSRSENSLDEPGELRELPAHTMASHRFPLDHIPHSNC